MCCFVFGIFFTSNNSNLCPVNWGYEKKISGCSKSILENISYLSISYYFFDEKRYFDAFSLYFLVCLQKEHFTVIQFLVRKTQLLLNQNLNCFHYFLLCSFFCCILISFYFFGRLVRCKIKRFCDSNFPMWLYFEPAVTLNYFRHIDLSFLFLNLWWNNSICPSFFNTMNPAFSNSIYFGAFPALANHHFYFF